MTWVHVAHSWPQSRFGANCALPLEFQPFHSRPQKLLTILDSLLSSLIPSQAEPRYPRSHGPDPASMKAQRNMSIPQMLGYAIKVEWENVERFDWHIDFLPKTTSSTWIYPGSTKTLRVIVVWYRDALKFIISVVDFTCLQKLHNIIVNYQSLSQVDAESRNFRNDTMTYHIASPRCSIFTRPLCSDQLMIFMIVLPFMWLCWMPFYFVKPICQVKLL